MHLQLGVFIRRIAMEIYAIVTRNKHFLNEKSYNFHTRSLSPYFSNTIENTKRFFKRRKMKLFLNKFECIIK